LKNLISDKEFDKANARTFAKICHNAPCIVLNEAIKQLLTYNNIIPFVCTSMTYSMQFSVEVSLFLSMRLLCEEGRQTVREEEGLIETWLQDLSFFIGLTMKKHHKVTGNHQVELTGLFVFIAGKLGSDSDRDAVNIVLLKEILSKMSGYEIIPDLTSSQLAAMSGGIALKTEALGLAEQVRR
jgi:THO complex subunit 2